MPMHKLLENYVTLKKDSRVIEHDDHVLRLLEEQLRQNPDDVTAITKLTIRQQKLLTAYRSVLTCLPLRFLRQIHTYLFRCREVIAERISAKGRTKKWLKIIKVGNDDFREVYETVWRKTILVSEQEGIKKYKRSVAKLQATLPRRNPKQDKKQLLPLYRQAARVKPDYDRTILEIAARFENETGLALDLQICPTLKKVSRIVEKSLLKSKVEGEVANVKDIVRLVFDGTRTQNIHAYTLIDDYVNFRRS